MAKIINGALSTGFIQPRVAAILTQAENDLAQQPFFGGAQLSLADFLIIYNIEGCYTRGLLADYPNITEWRDRMRAMPSFQAAMQKDDRPSMILPLA
jgi:glutathione S-transferase